MEDSHLAIAMQQGLNIASFRMFFMGADDVIFSIISELLNKSPISVVLILLLSYAIWSKFFNEGKFGPNSIDDIFDILVVFLILLFGLASLTFLLIYLTPLLKLQPDTVYLSSSI